MNFAEVAAKRQQNSLSMLIGAFIKMQMQILQ